MANPKNKKPSTNNIYYWLLLLPIAALVVLAIVLIPKSKHHDWDDDDEDNEDSPTTVVDRPRGNSAIDRFTDEEILNLPEAPDPEWGGNSPAFRKEVAPGIVISARKNAFEEPTDVKFRLATEAEHKEAVKVVERQLQHHIPLFAFDLDAGLEAGQHIPGTFNVEMDLKKLEVPEDIWDGLSVCRIDESGIAQQWNCQVKDGKFSFDTDRNCLWVITCCAVAALAAKVGVSALLTGTIVVAGAYPYLHCLGYHLSAYGFQPLAYARFKDSRCGMVSIGFLPEETEHPHPDKYRSLLKKISNRLDELKEEALEEERENEAYRASLRNPDNPVRIYYGVDEQYAFANNYTNKVKNDDELAELMQDPDYETPQSILNIKKMVEVSLGYLSGVQGLKVPGSICNIYLGNGKLTMDQLGGYNNIGDASPWIGILYANKYVRRVNSDQPYPRTINENEGNKIFITLCHELFHHFHTSYVVNSVFRDSRLTEAGASVLERDFAQWLYDLGKLDLDPRDPRADNKYEFVDRTNKRWLLASLCSPVLPTNVKLDPLLGLCKTYANLVIMAVKRNLMMLLPGQVTQEMVEKTINEAKQALNELPEKAHLTIEQINDLCGFLGEAFTGGVNCDTGYMLGDFIDYLRKHVNSTTRLHDILMYGSGWDVAKALRQGFKIEKEEDFYQHYKGFIKENIKDILNNQTTFIDTQKYKELYHGQLIEKILFNRENCVQQLKSWTQVGAYACRTVSFGAPEAQGNYNLMLVPSPAMKGAGEKAVEAVILRKDTTFAPTPIYLEADSNSNCSPNLAALIFTDKMSEVSLTDAHYYDAVAFYAPKEKPTKVLVPNGQYCLQLKEHPVEALAKKHYVTGVQFMLKNNRTGKKVMGKELYNPDSPIPTTVFLTPPDIREGEEPDVTVYARWYYQPNPNDTTCYYSVWSEEGEDTVSLIVDNDTYIYEAGAYSDHDQTDNSRHAKGHLKVWSDGRFEWSSPSFTWTKYKVSSFTCSGRGIFGLDPNAEIRFSDEMIRNIDPSSFRSSTLKVEETKVNSRGEEEVVTKTYNITNVRDGTISFNNPESPVALIKVYLEFPGLNIYGYSAAGQLHGSPFDF